MNAQISFESNKGQGSRGPDIEQGLDWVLPERHGLKLPARRRSWSCSRRIIMPDPMHPLHGADHPSIQTATTFTLHSLHSAQELTPLDAMRGPRISSSSAARAGAA